MARLSRLSFIPSSQPPRPPLPPSPLLSSLVSHLLFLQFFSVVFGSSLYFENPVPFLFVFFFSNIDTQTVQPTRNFYFCKDREGGRGGGRGGGGGRVDDRSTGDFWECAMSLLGGAGRIRA